MFKGLSAFPLSPIRHGTLDLNAFEKLVGNLVGARVDSICVPGSTGLYPYLSKGQIFALTSRCVYASENIPVIAGIGALKTQEVLANLENVQKAGVSAVLLAPMSYHPLLENEVYELYRAVDSESSIPICLYDNPMATGFDFSADLYASISDLPMVKAIKFPGRKLDEGFDINEATLDLSGDVVLGISGDQYALDALSNGCKLWFSVVGGLLPELALKLMCVNDPHYSEEARQLNAQLQPLWVMFGKYKGAVRVVAEFAKAIGYVDYFCLPRPFLPLQEEDYNMLIVLADVLRSQGYLK
ncbi:MAG: dihydrodipicolinate synthase family protein [Oceanospirillaceae bacterium]|nr:dihydrodipicolinate synthase family protein [Oceanospirillaceae bacterium]